MASKIETEILGAVKGRMKPARRKSGEDEQEYFVRIIDATQEMSGDDWEELSKKAQDWINRATDLDNEEEEIPPFPDDDAGEDKKKTTRKSKAKAKADEEEEDENGDEEEEDEEDPEEDEDEEEEDENGEEEEEEDEGEEEEEEEEKPAPKKTTSKSTSTKKTTAKKTTATKKTTAKAADKPKPKSSGSGAKKPTMSLTLKTILVKKPKMSVDDLVEALGKKGFDRVSKVTVSTIRSDTLHTLRVLKSVGMLDIDV